MKIRDLIHWILGIFTAVVGYQVNINTDYPVFWAVVDFIFYPVTWLYWLITQKVSVKIIHDAFSFFLK